MTTPVLALPPVEAASVPLKKKRVLLVDASRATRDLRAETMRRLGMDVDSAADISEARAWWRADLYNLVLINGENDLGHRDKFCEDIRSAKPPQHVAFLVGKPEYLADAPHTNGVSSAQKDDDQTLPDAAAATPDVSGGLPQRWGILEASRRISAVRSVSAARSTAIRNRPTPPRDLETRESKRISAWSQLLPELQKEEIQ